MKDSNIQAMQNHVSENGSNQEGGSNNHRSEVVDGQNNQTCQKKVEGIDLELHERLKLKYLNPALESRVVKVFRNGQDIRRPIHVFLNNRSESWSEFILKVEIATQVPIHKVYSTNGEKLSTFDQLEQCQEIVVCGDEPFKMLPYGRQEYELALSLATNVRPKTRQTARESLARSVILEASSMDDADPKQGLNNPLVKTCSEQDVSSMEITLASPKLRIRQSHSPKPRPMSAYQGSMSISTDRNSPIVTPTASRIPISKRYISNASTNTNNQTPPITSSNSSIPSKSKKTEDKVINLGRPSRHDALKRESLPAKLIYVVRHGRKPRKFRRILLNQKTTAPTLDHVLNHITESLKPDWGAVRKVYTFKKLEVSKVQDFFEDENIFLACPNDRISPNDFYLDVAERLSMQLYFKDKPSSSKQTKLRNSEISQSPSRRPKSSPQSQNNNTDSDYANHPKNLRAENFPAPILEKYSVGEIIGDGNFAVVRKCLHLRTNKPYALKVIDKAKGKGRGDAPPEHEVKILGMVKHPNVIEMYEQYDFKNDLFIVLELVEGGDLFEAIAQVTKFSEEESGSMTIDVASALSFLHRKKIIHRDIKPENLLVYTDKNGKLRIKLGDFGLAQIIDGPLYAVCGTPTYVAPEILAESGYGRKVDIWALGVIVYVLLCGYPPFVSPSGEQEHLFELILNADFEFHPDSWDSISADAKHIIGRMIEPDPDLRWNADEVLLHPWICIESKSSQESLIDAQESLELRVFASMGLTDLHASTSRSSPRDVKAS